MDRFESSLGDFLLYKNIRKKGGFMNSVKLFKKLCSSRLSQLNVLKTALAVFGGKVEDITPEQLEIASELFI